MIFNINDRILSLLYDFYPHNDKYFIPISENDARAIYYVDQVTNHEPSPDNVIYCKIRKSFLILNKRYVGKNINIDKFNLDKKFIMECIRCNAFV